jgi:ABC-type transport system involved in multi-copper enzyme maturation permease subunit
MLREFEIFSKPSFPTMAVKRGFSWPGFFFSWIWAFTRGLWIHGTVILAAGVAIGFIDLIFFGASWWVSNLLVLVLNIVVGVRGNSWRSRKLEHNGYDFTALIEARSPASAVAAHSLGKKQVAVRVSTGIGFFSVPPWARGILAIAGLTWKSALRFRLFMVIAVLLLAAVVGLPVLIKDDGTARGFTQIVLTYTLSAISALLGFSTLWLSCGTLARDIEECQMQVVVSKPIARWQIWLGKWLGIVSLNAALLALSGACVYGLLQWRATKLPAKEQEVLHNEVLVARGAMKPPDVQEEIKSNATQILQERLKQSPVAKADLAEVQRQIVEQVKAEYELVPPGYTRIWEINFGAKPVRDQPLQLRVKFNTADQRTSGTFLGLWQVGVPEKTKLWHGQQSLAPNTFHEFTIDPGLLDSNGVLTVSFANLNNTALIFPSDEGMEVLYREGSFGLNFIRGLGVILCWMALLAAIGLASASFLSFPVAAFLSFAIMTMTLSSGTLAGVVEDKTINNNSGGTDNPIVAVLNVVIVPVFGWVLDVINLVEEYSPISSLSTGHSISWHDLAMAFVRIVVVLGGIFALLGILIFNRRELATAQNQA